MSRRMRIFCYGSNHKAKLEGITGAKDLQPRRAVLQDYVRVFAGDSKYWGGAVASIEPKKGSRVHGAVNELTRAQLLKLDAWEHMYDRVKVTVDVDAGSSLKCFECFVYVRRDHTYVKPPSPEYLKAVRKMLREVGSRQRSWDSGNQRGCL